MNFILRASFLNPILQKYVFDGDLALLFKIICRSKKGNLKKRVKKARNKLSKLATSWPHEFLSRASERSSSRAWRVSICVPRHIKSYEGLFESLQTVSRGPLTFTQFHSWVGVFKGCNRSVSSFTGDIGCINLLRGFDLSINIWELTRFAFISF